MGIGGLRSELDRFLVGRDRLFRLTRLGQEQTHHEMGIGLLQMARDKCLDPFFDFGDVVQFL